MKRMLADLHLHSTASDGKLNPEEVMYHANESGLSAVSLTDHDTIAGLKSARKAALQYGIEYINGVELSTFLNGKECHILGYGFDEDDEALNELFQNQSSSRRTRADAMIHELNKLGMDITFDEVWAEAIHSPISRVHIARVMIDKGYCATQQEVFMKFLGNQAPAYVPFELVGAEEGIAAIRAAGGVAILAHPSNYYLYEDLKKLMDWGIAGFEYIHPSHNYTQQMKYINHARNHDLLVTGGSDFHGYLNKDYLNLGMVGIDMEHYRNLCEYVAIHAQSINTQVT